MNEIEEKAVRKDGDATMSDLLDKEISELTQQKEIEEMAKDIPYLTLNRTVFVSATETENASWTLSEEDNKVIAESLVVKGYRKLPKGSIVLSKEMYEQLLNKECLRGWIWKEGFNDGKEMYSEQLAEMRDTIINLKEELAQARKDMATEIFTKLQSMGKLHTEFDWNDYLKIDVDDFYKLAKEYGVEVK